MDYTLFEDSKCISAIYKENLPDFHEIEIVKVVIVPGKDACLSVTFDISELPRQLPLKWKLQGVNTIQIEISFISIEIIKCNITNGSKCSFELIKKGDRRHVIFKDIMGKKEICIEAKWVYANSISAYIKQILNEEV